MPMLILVNLIGLTRDLISLRNLFLRRFKFFHILFYVAIFASLCSDDILMIFVTVTLRWRLHFEFVTSKVALPLPSNRAASAPSEPVTWQGPAHLDVETMVWDLPIKVFATNPVFVSSVSLLRSQVSCVI